MKLRLFIILALVFTISLEASARRKKRRSSGRGMSIPSSTIPSTELQKNPLFVDQSQSGAVTLGGLSYKVTQQLDKEIGKGNGYTLHGAVGWATLNNDGSIRMSSKVTHCTSATHAHFLRYMGELQQRGGGKMRTYSRSTDDLFTD